MILPSNAKIPRITIVFLNGFFILDFKEDIKPNTDERQSSSNIGGCPEESTQCYSPWLRRVELTSLIACLPK